MEASLEHHKILKRMCLADRLPAKIYDDMSNLIQGLPLEKQVHFYSVVLLVGCYVVKYTQVLEGNFD